MEVFDRDGKSVKMTREEYATYEAAARARADKAGKADKADEAPKE